jgi:hypothetical protein
MIKNRNLAEMAKRELEEAAYVLLGMRKRPKPEGTTEWWVPDGAFSVFDRTNMIVRCIASYPPATQGLEWERAPDGITPCPRCLSCPWQVIWVKDGSVRCMACSHRRF